MSQRKGGKGMQFPSDFIALGSKAGSAGGGGSKRGDGGAGGSASGSSGAQSASGGAGFKKSGGASGSGSAGAGGAGGKAGKAVPPEWETMATDIDDISNFMQVNSKDGNLLNPGQMFGCV